MNQKDQFVDFLLEKLAECVVNIKYQWNNPSGTNTRHFYIDNLLNEKICRSIYNSFPKDGQGFFSRETFREKKRTSANLKDYNPILADITYAFQDKRVVDLIAEMVKFKEIEPDPKLYAGGDKYVEEIAQLARQILVDYYKFCETTYEQGRVMLMEKGGLI